MIVAALSLGLPDVFVALVLVSAGWVAGREAGFHAGYRAAMRRVNRWHARERT